MPAKKQPKTAVYRARQAGAGLDRGEVFESDGSHPLILAGMAELVGDAPPVDAPAKVTDAVAGSENGSDADSSKS